MNVDDDSPRFERHIFVCTNQRDPKDARGCCGAKGSEALRLLFKEEIKKAGLKGKVRANSAGCLDYCEQGPTVVIYPEAVWYFIDTPDDVKELMQRHVLKGEIVERLRLPRKKSKTASGATPA